MYSQYPRTIAGYVCFTCGATVANEDIRQHDNFHLTFTNRSDGNMSKVLWCDPGNHAFKANSEGSIHYQGSAILDGQTVSSDVDACIEHNPFIPKDDNKRLTAQAETELSRL